MDTGADDSTFPQPSDQHDCGAEEGDLSEHFSNVRACEFLRVSMKTLTITVCQASLERRENAVYNWWIGKWNLRGNSKVC